MTFKVSYYSEFYLCSQTWITFKTIKNFVQFNKLLYKIQFFQWSFFGRIIRTVLHKKINCQIFGNFHHEMYQILHILSGKNFQISANLASFVIKISQNLPNFAINPQIWQFTFLQCGTVHRLWSQDIVIFFEWSSPAIFTLNPKSLVIVFFATIARIFIHSALLFLKGKSPGFHFGWMNHYSPRRKKPRKVCVCVHFAAAEDEFRVDSLYGLAEKENIYTILWSTILGIRTPIVFSSQYKRAKSSRVFSVFKSL